MAPESANKPAQPVDQLLPYRLREKFLTAPQTALYRALTEMAADRYAIFAKVALQEIFSIVRPNENVHYFNKLFRKHVDFLLCHPRSLRPQVGIELVRHAGADEMRVADQFMEDLFLTAGLPLVQVPPNDHYEIPEIIALFQAALSKVTQVERRLAGVSQRAIPACPICGKLMVLRTRRVEAGAPGLYYGCIDNPACPGTMGLP